MLTVNELKSYKFELASGDTLPTTWNLRPYIPGGVLRQNHLEVRSSLDGVSFSDWGPTTGGFSSTTLSAVHSAPVGTTVVEFRRSTPRYELVSDPLDSASRVTELNLEDNATQGLFIAIERAADYGYDAYDILLPGDDGINNLGLVQQTQNHWPSTFDFKGNRVYNFQFSGGYIAKSTVKVQVKRNGVWENFPISPSDFIGPWQLLLDFRPFTDEISGLVIRRFTPRDGRVPSPLDGVVIDGDNIAASAKQAFFAAVEIGEELTKLVPLCECITMYTSLLYPTEVRDELRVAGGEVVSGWEMGVTRDSASMSFAGITNGALVSPLLLYDRAIKENVRVGTAGITAGSLVSSNLPTISVDAEPMQVSIVTADSGTLIEQTFVNYNRARKENVRISVGRILSGTLT